jgi:plastocyanin
LISDLILAIAVAGVLLASGCKSSRTDPPFVQASSTGSPATSVAITPAAAYSPECVAIKPGQTVEWYTRAPELPVDVTSISKNDEGEVELFSPVIVEPLDCGTPGRTCWRHTFREIGCFEYTNSQALAAGGTGGLVQNAYYGTVSPGGGSASSSAAQGVVCVTSDGTCKGLCCRFDNDCPAPLGDRHYTCDKGRCVGIDVEPADAGVALPATPRPVGCAEYTGIH